LLKAESGVFEQQAVIENKTITLEINIPKSIEAGMYSLELVESTSLERYKKEIEIMDSKAWLIFFILLGILLIIPIVYYGLLYLYTFYYYNKEKINFDYFRKWREQRKERHEQKKIQKTTSSPHKIGSFKDFKKEKPKKEIKEEVKKKPDEKNLEEKKRIEKERKRIDKKKRLIAEKYIIDTIKAKTRKEKRVVRLIEDMQKKILLIRESLDKKKINIASKHFSDLKILYKKINDKIAEFDIKESKHLLEVLESTKDMIDEKRKPIDVMKILQVNHLIDETMLKDKRLSSFSKYEKTKGSLKKMGIPDLLEEKKISKDKPEFIGFFKEKQQPLLFELENEIEIEKSMNKNYSKGTKASITEFNKIVKECEKFKDKKKKLKPLYNKLHRLYVKLKDSEMDFEAKIIFFDRVNIIYNYLKR